MKKIRINEFEFDSLEDLQKMIKKQIEGMKKENEKRARKAKKK